MHKTAAEWSKVRAQAVTSGSVAQATNVLQMALDDIASLAAKPELRAADCTTKDWEQWARERREYEEPYGAIGGRY